MVRRKTGRESSDRQRAVIFDFDGTIADSFDYVFNFLRREAGNTAVYSVEEHEAMRQMSMKRLALHLGVPVWRLAGVYFKGRRVMRAHMEHVHSFAGMSEVVRQLHSDGYSLFIASANSRHNIRLLLKHEGLTNCFTLVRGGSGYSGKANLIRGLLSRYRLGKDSTWYVGDETSDVVAAARVGIPCLAVTWGFADPEKLRHVEPTAIAEKPADIPSIINDALKA